MSVHASVRAAFAAFTERYEGRISWMYLDIRGLVTIGAGCLIDPLDNRALSLPLVDASGRRASSGDIEREWRTIKGHQGLAKQGAGAARKLAMLRLRPEDLDALTLRTFDVQTAALLRRFPDLPNWPAPAQLALESMAWALGTGFRFPKCEAAMRARNWATAADECKIREAGNPGVAPRNVANRALFLAAAEVERTGSDPSALPAV